VLCLALWHPAHVEPQAADLAARAGQALGAGRVDDAIAMFEKAVAADPNDPAALAWLGSAQVRKAREGSMFAAADWVIKGFTTMDQAVARFPSAFIVYMVRGITATNVPDFFKKAPVAVQDLSAIVAMKQKDPASVPDVVMPSVYLHLGRAYKKNEQAAEARAAWEKGKSAYPDAPEAPSIDKELQETRP
jgi:tetratricopeptide (TPR) repeat protein